MRARVVCNRYAPGYRSVSVRIQKNQLFRDVYPRNVCLPRINNTIHRKVFVFRGQKSVSNRCKILYLKISNAPICTVLTPDARTVYNAIMIFAPEQNLKTQSKLRIQTTAVLGRYYLSFYHIRQYPAIEKSPADHHDQQGARSISYIGKFINCIRFLSDYCKDVAAI